MTKILKLEGIDCANCAAKIERGISKIKGVEEANVDFMTTKLFLDAAVIDDSLIDAIKAVVRKVDSNVVVKGV